MTTTEERYITTEDGFKIDTETGEIVGVDVPDELTGADCMTADLALWAIRKYVRIDATAKAASIVRDQAESDMAAILDLAVKIAKSSAPYIEAEAIAARSGDIIARTDKARKYMDLAWLDQVSRYASGQLSGKERTWRTPYGSVSLKTIPAALKVADAELALVAAEERWPEAVKTEKTFLISKLGKDAKAELINNPLAAEEFGFRVEPERDKAEVLTGI